jgi:hypothetical protein
MNSGMVGDNSVRGWSKSRVLDEFIRTIILKPP